MKDVRVVRGNDIFHYDAQVDGYSSGDIFKTVSGSPAISSNELSLNAAEIVSLQGVGLGDLEMLIKIPAVPTAGDARRWGFKTVQGGDLGRMEFEILEDVFQVIVHDNDGTALDTIEIPWDGDWTAAEVRYGIKRHLRSVYFTINGEVKAQVTDSNLTKRSLGIHADNDNADALLISTINVV